MLSVHRVMLTRDYVDVLRCGFGVNDGCTATGNAADKENMFMSRFVVAFDTATTSLTGRDIYDS